MTGSSWPASPTTTPTPIQRKWRNVAIGKDESQIHHVFFQEVEEDVDNDEIQEATVVSILTSYRSVFYLFWQVEDLAQQAECPDIEVSPNVSEKEVKHDKLAKLRRCASRVSFLSKKFGPN